MKLMFHECLEIRWKLLIFASFISPSKISFCLRSNIKHPTQCFMTRWNTLKFIINTLLHVVFSTHFSVFHLVMKHCVHLMLDLLHPGLFTEFQVCIGWREGELQENFKNDTLFYDRTQKLQKLWILHLLSQGRLSRIVGQFVPEQVN